MREPVSSGALDRASVKGVICSVVNRIYPEMAVSDDGDHLFMRGSKIDSMGLVAVVLGIENAMRDDYGVPIRILTSKALSMTDSPFRTVGSFTDFVHGLCTR